MLRAFLIFCFVLCTVLYAFPVSDESPHACKFQQKPVSLKVRYRNKTAYLYKLIQRKVYLFKGATKGALINATLTNDSLTTQTPGVLSTLLPTKVLSPDERWKTTVLALSVTLSVSSLILLLILIYYKCRSILNVSCDSMCLQ